MAVPTSAPEEHVVSPGGLSSGAISEEGDSAYYYTRNIVAYFDTTISLAVMGRKMKISDFFKKFSFGKFKFSIQIFYI